jgi:hypothetical protein
MARGAGVIGQAADAALKVQSCTIFGSRSRDKLRDKGSL